MKLASRDQIYEDSKNARSNFRRIDLESADLSGLDLSGADFRFSDLSGVNFSNAVLKKTNLSFSNLDDTNFENADLTDANLSFSSMVGANLTNAKIVGASFNFSGINKRNPSDRFASLTHFLYRTGWFGNMIGIFIGAFIFYGVSAVIYFTHQIFTASDPLLATLNQYIVGNNISGGVITVLITNWLSSPLERYFKTTWVQHLVLSLIVGIGYLGLTTFSYFQFGHEIITEVLAKFPNQVTSSAPWYIYVLCPIFVANVFHYFQKQGKQLTLKITEQELQLSELEKSKTKAELEALQAKINPHFLYNSLNSIASLVHIDPDKAEQMTLLLSKLFRYVTNKNADYFDTLNNELEMVATYLEIEQVRFGDRLSFKIIVRDEALKNVPVPRFLIQPVVENAIKHGIARIADRGVIEVRVTQEQNLLRITVHDNGPSFPEPISGGYGLQSIQNKLKLLYGNKAALSLQNLPLKQVVLDLPFKTPPLTPPQ
ncbi:pentapeptide repeat-containing protein [Runella sp.]|uniref:pentapeptide repeat-containing protein n=1 Tax=Runella sp. TaxID=1960881 RepID=UPI003D0B5552